MTPDPLRRAILEVADALESAREELCALDGIAGDGDHGLTMAIAAKAIRKQLREVPEAREADLLQVVAAAVASVGGASGPIYSTAIARVAYELRAMPDHEPISTRVIRKFAESGYEAVRELGMASPGDKTILDAFLPAVEALRSAEALGVPVAEAAEGAASAARDGAASTASMVARVGRASRLGERSRGSADPGATSFAIALRALVDALRSDEPSRESLKRVLVGTSWKMNLTSSEARTYLTTLRPLVAGLSDRDLFVLPSFTSIWVAQEMLADTPLAWGAQDVHPEGDGDHTGDISARMLADLGCRFVEVGHAERRRDHREDDSVVGAKLAAVLRTGMVPILCVGETSYRGIDEAVTRTGRQLRVALTNAPEAPDLVVAYEPLWAIGVGKSPPSRERVVTVHASLREVARGMLEPDARLRIIYGGSVDEESAGWLLAEAEVDGVFVGRAALDPYRFAAIARTPLRESARSSCVTSRELEGGVA